MAATETKRAPLPLPAHTEPDPNAVIQFRGVSKTYDSGDVGLDDATFAISRGEFVFVVGQTGSGKSTIMRLLLKEHEATEGRIVVAGRDLSEIEPKKVPYYRRNLGVVFQDFKLLPNRTVYDNVAYALQVTGRSRKEIRQKVPDILRLTGLATKLHNYPDQLSGGEQQRVSVARAFVNHPPLLLADEPTGNLDPETSVGIMQLLYRINRTGTTVLVATHDSHMVDRMRRRVIELDRGRIVRDEADAMYGRREPSTAEFGCPHAGSRGWTGTSFSGWRRTRSTRSTRRGDETRLLHQGGAALDPAQPDPELCRDGQHARHAAGAGRLHPDGAGHHGRGQHGARARAARRLHAARRDQQRPRARAPADQRRHAARQEGRVRLQGAGLQGGVQEQPGGLQAARVQPAAGHLPRHARRPGQHRVDPRRARPAQRAGAPPGRSTSRSSWCATRRTRPTRSSRSPSS